MNFVAKDMKIVSVEKENNGGWGGGWSLCEKVKGVPGNEAQAC